MDPQEQQSIEKESPTKTLPTTPEQTEQPPLMEPHVEEGSNGVKQDCAGREEEPKSEKKEEEDEMWESDALPPEMLAEWVATDKKFRDMSKEIYKKLSPINDEIQRLENEIKDARTRLRAMHEENRETYSKKVQEVMKEHKEKAKTKGPFIVSIDFPTEILTKEICLKICELTRSLVLWGECCVGSKTSDITVKGLEDIVTYFMENLDTWFGYDNESCDEVGTEKKEKGLPHRYKVSIYGNVEELGYNSFAFDVWDDDGKLRECFEFFMMKKIRRYGRKGKWEKRINELEERMETKGFKAQDPFNETGIEMGKEIRSN